MGVRLGILESFIFSWFKLHKADENDVDILIFLVNGVEVVIGSGVV